MAERRRQEREERERRVIDLAERVMVAIGERDAAVAEIEKRAGETLRELTEREGLLRRLASESQAGGDGEQNSVRDGAQGGDGAALATVRSGGAGPGSAVG